MGERAGWGGYKRYELWLDGKTYQLQTDAERAKAINTAHLLTEYLEQKSKGTK